MTRVFAWRVRNGTPCVHARPPVGRPGLAGSWLGAGLGLCHVCGDHAVGPGESIRNCKQSSSNRCHNRHQSRIQF